MALAFGCLAVPRTLRFPTMARSRWVPVSDQPPALLKKIQITQKLNAPLPLGLHFRDETGKTVSLGDYFGKRPAILSLVSTGAKCSVRRKSTGWWARSRW